MTHVWKRKLNNLNNCLQKNNFPKLRILTDTKGNVVYLDKFLEVGDMFLDFCDDSDIQYLFNDIEIVENYFEIRDKNKRRGIRLAILKDIVKNIPNKIEVFT